MRHVQIQESHFLLIYEDRSVIHEFGEFHILVGKSLAIGEIYLCKSWTKTTLIICLLQLE